MNKIKKIITTIIVFVQMFSTFGTINVSTVRANGNLETLNSTEEELLEAIDELNKEQPLDGGPSDEDIFNNQSEETPESSEAEHESTEINGENETLLNEDNAEKQQAAEVEDDEANIQTDENEDNEELSDEETVETDNNVEDDVSTPTNYYVSSLNGDDSNDGQSIEESFRTLDQINEITLNPGDQVLLEADSVFNNQFLHIKGSGAAGNPIIIDKYGEGDNPVINANGEGVWYQDYGMPLDNARHEYQGDVSTAVLLYDVEYIEISNLEITNDPQDPDEIFNTDDKMNRTGVGVVAQNKGTLDHIHLKNLYIHDVNGNVHDKQMVNGGINIVAFLADNIEETGPARYNDILIENNTVENVRRTGIAVGYTVHYKDIPYGELPDELMETYGATNVIVRNNFVDDVGGDGIIVHYALRPLIEYNVSVGVAKDINPPIYEEYYDNFQEVSAGIWPWMSKDAVFQHNEAYDTKYNVDAQAWDADFGDGTIYQYNYSHNNAGGAIMICSIHAYNSVFRYNISQEDLSGPVNLLNNPFAHFYNNVFYMAEDTPFIRTSMRDGAALFENNIIYNPGEVKQETWEHTTRQEYNNNIYFNYSNTPESDENAIVEDPLFINPGSGPTSSDTNGNVFDKSIFDGYKIQPDSPAINAGVYIENNGGLDFFGNELDRSPDIGVFDTQTPAENQHTEIVDTIFDFDGTNLYVPHLSNNPMRINELISGIEVDSYSYIEIHRNGEIVSAGNFEPGDKIVVISENGDTSEYNIEVKNDYVLSNEYSFEAQGNIWFYQVKDNGEYTNLSEINDNNEWTDYVPGARVGNGVISDSSQLEHQKEGYSVAFRSPATGEVTLDIEQPLQLASSNEGGNVIVSVTLNGVNTIDNIILPNDASPESIEPITLEITEGDMLRIEINNEFEEGNNEITNGTAIVKPIITFNDVLPITDDVLEHFEIPSDEITVSATSELPYSVWDVEGPVEYAIDDNLNSYWHTNYEVPGVLPESIMFEFNNDETIDRIKYTPRAKGSNGNLRDYVIYTSDDGTNWTEIRRGELPDTGQPMYITFNPVNTEHLRVEYLTSYGDTEPNQWATAVEYDIYRVIPDKAELQELISEAENMHLNNYTSESAELVLEILEEARLVLSEQQVSQEAVDKAVLELQTALNNLEELDVEHLRIPNASIEVSATSELPYAVFDREGPVRFAMDENLDTYWHTNYDVPGELPESIMFEFEDSQEINRIKYTPRSIGSNGNLRDYIIYASDDGENWSEISNGTLPDLGEPMFIQFNPVVTKHLRVEYQTSYGDTEPNMWATAVEYALYGATTVDKSQLENLLEEANTLDTTGYSDESVNALEAAILDAQNVMDNPNASDVDVANALDNLEKAINGLVLPIEKLVLENTIKIANKILEVEEVYTEESIKKLKEILEIAISVFDNNDASIEDIEEVTDNLTNSILALVEKPEVNKEDLLDLLIEGEIKLNEGIYTEETVAVLRKAVAEAYDVVLDDNTTQEEIDLMTENLTNAIENLVVIIDEKPGDDGEDETPSDEIEQLENRISELEEKVLKLEGENQELLDELVTLLERLSALKSDLNDNEEEIASLENRVAELEARVAELEEQDAGEPSPGGPVENDETLGNDNDLSNDDKTASEEETPSEDEPTKKDEDSKLPQTGQSNLLPVVLSGLALVFIGGWFAIKARRENN